MSTTAREPARIRMTQRPAAPTRTPVSSYLDQYIAEEIGCMVRELGGWRRGRGMRDQNRRAMEWIEKHAAQFRERWNKEHGVVAEVESVAA